MKKIFILLLILFVLAVVISASPILTYFQSLGAEEPAGSTDAAGENDTTADRSDETTSATADTSDGAEKKEPNRTAILFAVILSGLTILAALICYLKKSDPNRD